MRSRSRVPDIQLAPPLQLPFGGGVPSRSTKTGGAGGACTPRKEKTSQPSKGWCNRSWRSHDDCADGRSHDQRLQPGRAARFVAVIGSRLPEGPRKVFAADDIGKWKTPSAKSFRSLDAMVEHVDKMENSTTGVLPRRALTAKSTPPGVYGFAIAPRDFDPKKRPPLEAASQRRRYTGVVRARRQPSRAR